MKKMDVMDLLFMKKEEFQKLDGEVIDQMPPKQIARIPNCLWDMMTDEQIKHLSTSTLSTLDYNQLIKFYMRFYNETESYYISYKVKDKVVTVESEGMEPKLYGVIFNQKRYGNFKARGYFHRDECKEDMLFNNLDAIYNYMPKPTKDYMTWNENRELFTAYRQENVNGKKDTKNYFKFNDIVNLLKVARRDGEYILSDNVIPPLLSFTNLMSKYKVKYTLTSQFNERWKIPYYLLFCGRDFNELTEGTRYYDIIECEPILEKILQIEFSPPKIKKYKALNIIPRYCLEKIYPFLGDYLDVLIKEEKIDIYQNSENLLDYNSVIDYLQTVKLNKEMKTKRKPSDLPVLIDFYGYFKNLDLPNELLQELKSKLDVYEIDNHLYLNFPVERKHKMGGPYDEFRLKIISTIKEYVVYKYKLNDIQNEFYITNKIPDIYVECLISELLINYPDVKEYYISNVKEFYPIQRLDGLGYGDIGYLDYSKVKEYFNL